MAAPSAGRPSIGMMRVSWIISKHDHHVAGHLDDLVGVVVAGREHAGGVAARDAAHPRRLVLGRVGDVLQVEVALVLGPLHHRHAAVGRIHDHRPPPRADLVVVVGELGRRADVGRRRGAGGPRPAGGLRTGASNGVLSKLSQVPCRSGWPSGVFALRPRLASALKPLRTTPGPRRHTPLESTDAAQLSCAVLQRRHFSACGALFVPLADRGPAGQGCWRSSRRPCCP